MARRTQQAADTAPQFDVYVQARAVVFGTTRDVLVPYAANPVDAADADAAITIVAVAIAESAGDEEATTTYLAVLTGSPVVKMTTGFQRQPVFG